MTIPARAPRPRPRVGVRVKAWLQAGSSLCVNGPRRRGRRPRKRRRVVDSKAGEGQDQD